MKLISYIPTTGTQYGYRESKPVYSCDVSGGMLTCRDEGNDDHNMDLGVVCGPLEDNSMPGRLSYSDISLVCPMQYPATELMRCLDWWVDPSTEKAEWRCVWMDVGEQSVTTIRKE